MTTPPSWLRYELLACKRHEEVYKHEVYHWSKVSAEQISASGFGTARTSIKEYGLDALAYDPKKRTWHGIQVKLSPENATLSAARLASFTNVITCRLVRHNSRSLGFLYTQSSLTPELQTDWDTHGSFRLHNLPPDGLDDPGLLEYYDPPSNTTIDSESDEIITEDEDDDDDDSDESYLPTEEDESDDDFDESDDDDV